MAKNLISEIIQLRSQGLTDNIISEELTNRGYAPEQVNQALAQVDAGSGMPGMAGPADFPAAAYNQKPSMNSGGGFDPTLLDRMEEIAENIIDEKWDELVAEVKKIAEWKERVEEKQGKMQHDLDQLKEDFKLLHQGVLGKLEEYDSRMQDVGTELKAVGRVFKEVVPQFVDNVKELSSVTNRIKGQKNN